MPATNTAQAIGALTAQIEAMNARLDRDREDRKEADKEAAQSREEVKRGLAALEQGHKDILRRVDKIEPVTDMVTSWKAKVIGAIAVLGLIGGVLIGGFQLFREEITRLFTGG